MSDDEHTFTNEENPELAGLFHDLFEPAAELFTSSRLSVPEKHRVKVAEHLSVGQSFVIIPIAPGARARCAIQTEGGGVVELGSSKVEPSYHAVLDAFRQFGIDHMLHATKITKAHAEGSLTLLVVVLVDERRVRLVALQDADPAKHVALFELTGVETPAAMVN